MTLNREHTLLAAARAVREHAQAPLTGVQVGAALLTKDGTIITGCNVESASGIIHTCAERAAIYAAIAAGHREFTAIAVISDFPKPIPPCGFCRQALLEFAPDAAVIMATLDGQTKQATILALMPQAYRIEDRVPPATQGKGR